MAKKLQVLIMIFALGIFIVPKQVFFAQTSEMSCCATKSDKKDCCKTEKHNQKPCQKSEKHNCDGNCTNCSSCHFSIAFFNTPKIQQDADFQNSIQLKKEHFTYIAPSLSDIFTKIWQPPKIG